MKLADAEALAQEMVARLQGDCERIEVAGSVRRKRNEPHDLELVVIPRFEERQVSLLEMAQVSLLEANLYALCISGVMAFDSSVKRNGPKHKRLLHLESGIVVEIYAAEAGNWGLILALRTGPADFNKLLVANVAYGGAMPLTMRMQDGWLWRRGERVETRTEDEFFGAIGLPTWYPEVRSVHVLQSFLLLRASRRD